MRSNIISSHSHVRTAAAVLIVIVVCACGPLSAQQIPALSQRTGTIVSAAARKYFGLFPRIDGYRTATFRDAGDSVVAVIRRDAGDTSIPLSRAAFGQLRRYVDSFEAYHYAVPADWDGRMLRGIAHPVNVFPDETIPFAVETTTGGTVHGVLLYADDSLVVLGPDGYNPRREDVIAGVQVIRVRDIVRLHDRASGFASIFSSFDMRIGGNDTIYRAYALGPLRAVAVFNPLPPPEVTRAAAATPPSADASPTTIAFATFREEHRRSTIHVSFLYSYAELDRTYGGMPSSMKFPGLGDYVGPGVTFPDVGIQFDVGPFFRLGLWGSWTFPGSWSGGNRDGNYYAYRTLSGPSGLATVRWMLQRAGPLHDFGTDICDIAIGGGVAVRALESDLVTYLFDPTFPGPTEITRRVTTTPHTIIGPNLSLEVSWYLSNRLSIDSETRYTFWDDPLLPGSDIPSKYYQVRLSPWELLIGIGWHP